MNLRHLSHLPLASLVILVATMLMQSSAIAQNAMSQAQFDSIIFQQYGTAELARERLKTSIDLQIRRIEHSVPLSDLQEQKLQFAGQGDIQRFLNRVVAAQKKFQALDPEQEDFNEAYQIAAPLQMELATGLFGDESLFAKVVQTTLDKQQLEAHREQEAIRTRRANEAYLRMYLSTLETALPLTARQREALVELAASRFGKMRPKGPFQLQVVAYRLFHIPEEKIAEILDLAQMTAFREIGKKAEGFEQILRQRGVLDDEVE